MHQIILHEVTINIVSYLFTLRHSLKIILYLQNFCVFRIWVAEFVITITFDPQHLQSLFTTPFKATHIGVNMNAVSVSQSIIIRRYNVMKWVQYFVFFCRSNQQFSLPNKEFLYIDWLIYYKDTLSLNWTFYIYEKISCN